MRSSAVTLARHWLPSRLLSRILRGPVPFQVASETTEKLRAASDTWQQHIKSCIQRDPDDPYAGLLAHALGSDDEAQRVREEQGYTLGPIPGVVSLHFLRNEAKWRSLPPHKLWPRFQTIAWSLHDEVNRVAYNGTLAGRGQLLYVLTRGQEFADGDAGGLCLGSDTDGAEFRPFAVIGVTREWHASYEALKETLLHELAHWAVHKRHGHWQNLGPSEVATSGHGDFWHHEVHRIQGVFGDFVGFRFLTAASHEQPESTAAGDMGMYIHAYICGACGQRSRYASRGSERQRRCLECGTAAMAYIGQFDALSQPYPSQRNAAWRAYVAARFPAVFARIASPRSEVSAASVPDPNFAAETTAPDHSRYSLIDSEAALVREQALQELTDIFTGKHDTAPAYQAERLSSADSNPVWEALAWHIALPCTNQALRQNQPEATAQTVSAKQHESAQRGPRKSSAVDSDLAAAEIVSSAVAEVQASGAPALYRSTAFGASSGHTRALVRRAVGGGARSFESSDTEAVVAKRPSLQQRQWYLFQRAAWAEAQRQVAVGSEKSNMGDCVARFKGDRTGAVQRLVASWWHEHKREVMSELSGKEGSEAISSDSRYTVETADGKLTSASVVQDKESTTVLTESDIRPSLPITSESDIGNSSSSSSNRRSSRESNSSSVETGNRCSSTREADQYARTAHHVWKRFGARAWESGVTNDEARALYRAWS